MRLRIPVISALAFVAACGGDNSTATGVKTISRVDVVAGDNQHATVGTALGNAVVVKAVDASGNAVPNSVVNFVVTAGGGSVFAAAVQSDALGVASDVWTMGTTAGPQTLEVRAVVNGQPITYATFHATSTAGAPATLTKVAGDAQTGSASTALPTALQVRAADQYGNPVAGVSVAWLVTGGGGSVNTATTTTGADGTSQTSLTLGAVAGGTNSVTATVASIAAQLQTFTATARPASVVVKVSGDAQSGVVGAPLASPLVVRVTDATDVPLAGVTVTWAAGAGSGALSPTSGTTNASGQASSAWTLGSIGANTATASISGGASVSFAAIGSGAAGTVLTTVGGDTRQATVGHGSGDLVVHLADGAGHPVPGATIGWTITSAPAGGGATLGAATSTTDASGDAVMGLSAAGTVAGTVTISASANGVAPVTFTVVVDHGPVTNARSTDIPAMAPLGTTATFHLKYVDAYENAIPGYQASWTGLPMSGFILCHPTLTAPPADANGVTTASMSLCPIPGRQTAQFLGYEFHVMETIVATGAPTSIRYLGHGSNSMDDSDDEIVVTDANGAPAPDVVVTVAITSGAGHFTGASNFLNSPACSVSATTVTCTTDRYGQIEVLWTRDAAGLVTLSYSAPGYTSLTNSR